MKKTKRINSIIISLLLALSLTAGFIPLAFAAQEEQAKAPDIIKWDVSFDKSSYSLFGKAVATVKFTNTSDEILGSVVLSADSEGLESLKTEGNPIVLGIGETGIVRMELQLSSKAPGANFFARFLLLIRSLFKKGDALKGASGAKSSYDTSVDFGFGGRQAIRFCLNYGSLAMEQDPAAAQRKQGQKFFEDIQSKNAYTIKMNIRNVSGSEITETPMTMARSGNNKYLEIVAPIETSGDTDGGLTLKAYLKGDTAKIYTVEMKAYVVVPAAEFNEMFNSSLLNENTDKGVYKGTYKTSSGGKSYVIDVYESAEGTTRYYYENQELKRIESKYKDGSETTLEILEASATADSKLFDEPFGYTNLTDLLNS